MVLAADAPTALRGRVADAVAGGYARLGCTVVEMPLAEVSGLPGAPGTAVLAADLEAIECVADDDVAAAAQAVRLLAAAGWQVSLVVPAGSLGEAHRLLRGASVRLQPWWLGADDDVCFGAPEVP
jgi:hypothetical protein